MDKKIQRYFLIQHTGCSALEKILKTIMKITPGFKIAIRDL
jgi:hypothetical protein